MTAWPCASTRASPPPTQTATLTVTLRKQAAHSYPRIPPRHATPRAHTTQQRVVPPGAHRKNKNAPCRTRRLTGSYSKQAAMDFNAKQIVAIKLALGEKQASLGHARDRLKALVVSLKEQMQAGRVAAKRRSGSTNGVSLSDLTYIAPGRLSIEV